MRRLVASSESVALGFGGTSLVAAATGVSRRAAATSTKTGLKVKAQIDTNRYPSGLKVSDQELAAVNLERNAFHGGWNYKISPSTNETVVL